MFFVTNTLTLLRFIGVTWLSNSLQDDDKGARNIAARLGQWVELQVTVGHLEKLYELSIGKITDTPPEENTGVLILPYITLHQSLIYSLNI